MSAANVVRFRKTASNPARKADADAVAILGKLQRKDFELWVCRGGDGAITLKWWRWREEVERFYPLGEGGLVLDPAQLKPLAELLTSVSALLGQRDVL